MASKIEAAKNEAVAKGVKYTKLPESQWYTMGILAVDDLRAYLGQNAWKPTRRKSLYSYVVYDSSSVEQHLRRGAGPRRDGEGVRQTAGQFQDARAAGQPQPRLGLASGRYRARGACAS